MKKTRLEELENWATIMLEMDTMRRRCCSTIKDANECRKCPFWQQEDCFEVAPFTANMGYRSKDIAKMLAVGEAIFSLAQLGAYKAEEEW